MKEKSGTLLFYLREECGLIFRDRWLLALISWLPPLLFYLLFSVISDGVCRNLPVAVIDYDQSVLSRQFIRNYNSSPVIALTSYADETAAMTDLRKGNIYGVVIIPENLEENANKRLQPMISALVNYQYLLIGKQINRALQAAHTTTTVRLDIGRHLATDQPVFQSALAAASPIGVQFNTLANKNADYGQFLVTAMIPAVWQILVVMAAVMSFIATNRETDIYTWLQSERQKKITAKLLPLLGAFWLQGLAFLLTMFEFIGWPMRGSWLIMVTALGLTVFVCLGAGSVFYLLTCDGTRALSFSAAYTAPGLAFMGVTFPVSDMNIIARFWRNLLPVSHYSEIQIAVANYGAGIAQILKPVTALLLFSGLYILVSVLASLRGNHTPKSPETEVQR